MKITQLVNEGELQSMIICLQNFSHICLENLHIEKVCQEERCHQMLNLSASKFPGSSLYVVSGRDYSHGTRKRPTFCGKNNKKEGSEVWSFAILWGRWGGDNGVEARLKTLTVRSSCYQLIAVHNDIIFTPLTNAKHKLTLISARFK